MKFKINQKVIYSCRPGIARIKEFHEYDMYIIQYINENSIREIRELELIDVDFIPGQYLKHKTIVGELKEFDSDGNPVLWVDKMNIHCPLKESVPIYNEKGWNSFSAPVVLSVPCQLLVRDLRTYAYRLVSRIDNRLVEENGRMYSWEDNPYSHFKLVP